MAAESIKGACNCGAIQISVPNTSYPPYCGLCHCLNCRASSGSLFSVNLGIPTKEVTIKGTPKIFADKDSASGTRSTGISVGIAERECFLPTSSPTSSPNLRSGEYISAPTNANGIRAIMSVVAENPDIAYVKGGPFARLGVALPPAGAHIWWKRKEKWEKAEEGMQYLD